MEGLNKFFYGPGGLVVFVALIGFGLYLIATAPLDLSTLFIMVCGIGGLIAWYRHKASVGQQK